MQVANLYDNGPISPIAKIMENLTIWTVGKWQNYRIENIEPLPRSSPMIAEMVLINGLTFCPPYGALPKRAVPILQPRDLELLHLRWEPLDDVEGVLWEQPGSGRFVAQSVQARVNLDTVTRDPYLATTTFWVLGRDRQMNLEVRNPNPVVIPQARFVFWGFRYSLSVLAAAPATTTYLPAEGF